ncbi:hypothetical protein EQZ23_10795 [Sphingomonas sp. UV9]|uniref:hypothetical protein n=1 Tax=Sphingomonas sp. UV9 TaxID=1851410 RepID=UPI000FFC58A2|nr:hypothetical protein [Sphingomonas sp. UV9]RXD05538.1 hypothetical protein EQZ23_10795 [Sphingomonas sp. UV9]
MNRIDALIAEAKRQNPYRASFSERVMGLAKYQPFRSLWCARTAWLMFRDWNAPKGHEARMTLMQGWQYATSLAEMLDMGPMLPTEAIAEDRQYWDE